jgi:5-formyltetrahydrofolate cyclo-ligase
MFREKAKIRRFISDELARYKTGSGVTQDPWLKAQSLGKNLSRDPIFQKASKVALYAALPDEVQTLPVHQICMDQLKTVFYPRVDKDKKVLYFCPVTNPKSTTEMRRGFLGILEPFQTKPTAHIDLFIVPGVAFSVRGERLGRGSGYYDRTLSQSKFRHVNRYGLAYSFQVLEDLPVEDFDLPVQKVFTPEKVYMCTPCGFGEDS